MPKERIHQLNEILRHVKTQEMGKLKFALHFGITAETLEIIKTKLFLDDIRYN